ncbi:MAG: TRAP transporter substrate-binding protein DctP [Ectothiorhodospiraceae bacterium]|nr:TRAP transporter substrate-binding protein DctP [Ectothiorhodospiraceae bacterium]
MKRRQFLTGAGAGAAAVAASTVYSPNVIARNQRWRLEMVTSWPAALDKLYGGAQYFAELVEEATDGDVQIRTYPGGDQVGALEVRGAVARGAFPCCHTAPYYYIGESPAHGFYSAMPFGLTPDEHMSWMISGGGQELWDELNAPDNLVAFPMGNTMAQTGGWFNKRIESPADLRGLRMRFPGHGGRVMAKTGVNIQLLPAGEVFTAMERGALDAAEWIGPYDDTILGMYRVARYYYMPSWAEASVMGALYFNKDQWDEFPADIRMQIQACCHKAGNWMASEYMANNPPALEKLQSEHGIEVVNFPESVLDVFYEAAQEVHEEDMRDEKYRRIFENWDAFRRQVQAYNKLTTHQYQSYAYSRL